jgi:N-methylhydantoinase B/oxoprolinase/acetone carboxylase alpha subunit
MIDVGGTSAGGFGVTESIFQEGLRLPPVRIYANDEEVRDIFRIIISNVRTPTYSYGDLKALIGSLYIAERRLRELIGSYGLETFRNACEAIKDASETLVRRAIAAMEMQECAFEGFIEDDGVEKDSRSAIRGRIVVVGDELIVDFTGSSPQAKGQTNQTFGVTASATYAAAFFAIADALGVEVPFNQGAFRPISVIAPPGTFVNVLYPGACLGGNSDSSPTTVDTLLAAFARMTGKASAADGGTLGILVMSGTEPESGDIYTNLQFDGSGWGASWNHDGNSVQVGKTSNCANTPVEILETRYPIRCEEYSLNLSPLGAPGGGRHRGGFGCRRVFTVLGDKMTLSAHFNRTEVKPWGIDGGEEGGNSLLAFQLGGGSEWKKAGELFGTISNGKFRNAVLRRGDRILIEIGGGGGYGDPLERDPHHVLDDWKEGYLDIQTARDTYGVVISEESSGINVAATAQTRRERANA